MHQAASSKRDSRIAGSKFSPQLLAGIFVALFFIAALLFRIVFPYDHVFVGDWVKFTGTDAWYHMRIVDNLARNFPHLNTIDPYLLYPTPMSLGIERFFDYFLAAIIWMVGLGSPTQHTVDMVGVYLPAILGALTVIPVYFIGKVLANRWVGVIAAGLMAFSPGEFLGRSIIGQADHHVFEVLCSTTAMLFMLVAVRQARRGQLALKSLGGKAIARPLFYSVLAGIVLGVYLNAWLGALLFVFILFAYVIIQFIIDYVRGVTSDYLCFVGTVTFGITTIITLLLPHTTSQIAALLIALVTTVVLGILSRLMLAKGIQAEYYLAVLIGLGLVELAIFYVVKADFLQYMMSSFGALLPTGARLTIEEADSILLPRGEFSLMLVWLNFTTGSILALIALGMFIYLVIKRDEADKTLVVVWSLIILVLTLLMRRFAYYFAVNVAVLAGYVAWLILQFFGVSEKATQPALAADDVSKKAMQKMKKKEARGQSGLLLKAVGVIVVFFFVLFPNIIYARDLASFPQFTPSDAWCQSLDWLRNNTPEPHGKPDFYYGRYDRSFTQPTSAYGVAAHWDFGYWIARMGHRSPIINPGTIEGRDLVSNFFLAQDELSAVSSVKARDSKYVILDYDTAMPLRKYYSWLEYGGIERTKYFDVYVQRTAGQMTSVLLYYPAYYSSLAVRLYNFDGSQVVNQEPVVISYEEKVSREGTRYKEITGWKSFTSYDEAQTYLKNQKSGNYRIVGKEPFVSPIPLNSLKYFKLVYSSSDSVMVPDVGGVSEVKIFELVE